jgi:hypothetical protein
LLPQKIYFQNNWKLQNNYSIFAEQKIKMRQLKYYIVSKSWISQNMVNPFAARGMD